MLEASVIGDDDDEGELDVSGEIEATVGAAHESARAKEMSTLRKLAGR
jgi:hypothetical protein